jgi:hypothetical protein
MAKRKTAAAEAVPLPAETAAPAESTPPVEAANAGPSAKRYADPFLKNTVNVGGTKLQLQESRGSDQGWQMQIKFGDGSEKDKPSDPVREFIKSHRTTITTKAGETKDIQLFHWNNRDQAWGMKIDFDKPATSRQKAEQLFAEVVKLVAEERGASPER